MRKFYLFIFISLLCIFSGKLMSQSLILGAGTFGGTNTFGPMNSSPTANAYNRHAYIYPESMLTGLSHGDTIRSLEFNREGFDSLTGKASLVIFMKMTPANNFGPNNLNWLAESQSPGMIKVYDSNPKFTLGSSPGFKRFDFNVALFPVDTTGGRYNLEVLVEYSQTTPPSGTGTITWLYDNSITVPAYANDQVKYINGIGIPSDTTNSSNVRHPQMKINFPRTDFDAGVLQVLTLGKLPIPMGTPDTIKARIISEGKKTYTNLKVYLNIRGANPVFDSIMVPSIKPFDETVISFRPHPSAALGMDTVRVFVQPDGFSGNDQSFYLRLANNNVFSYTDLTQPAAGGVGFNNSTGDFVAKFHTTSPQTVNQVSVNFSQGSQPFQIGIWDATGPGGTPGNNIWTSPTQTSFPGTFILPVFPPVPVNGGFFTGVRQTGMSNVAFAFQYETPIRPGTFFFTAPLGNTTWTNFDPGFPFRFMIEPRMQVPNDVSVIAINNPRQGDTLRYNQKDTIAPRATITNYGANNQLTPFNITYEISSYGNIIYSSTKSDTLSSGISRVIRFDSTFVPLALGPNTVRVYTNLNSDQVKDNDTLNSVFHVAVYNDAGADIIFSPFQGSSFELNQDTITPTIRIQNFGSNDITTPFNVVCRIKTGNTIRYTSIKPQTINKGTTKIILFDPFVPDTPGMMMVEAFTLLPFDSIPGNDTTRATFTINKSNDVGVSMILFPAPSQVLLPNNDPVAPEAIVRNYGPADQDTQFMVTCIISKNGGTVYSDSRMLTLNSLSSANILFGKTFVPNVPGTYKMRVFTSLSKDQFRANDTLKTTFTILAGDDAAVTAMVNPRAQDTIQLSQAPLAPTAEIKNHGVNNQTAPFGVTYKILYGPTQVYSSTKQLTLDSGLSSVVTFDSTFVPEKEGLYSVTIYTSLAGDQETANDTFTSNFLVVKNNDVGIAGFLFPAPTGTVEQNSQPIGPRVSVRNTGMKDQTSPFSVTFSITRGATQIYADTKQVSFLAAGNMTTVYFDTSFVPNTLGNYSMEAFTDLSNDQVRSNDTLKSTFFVIRSNDVGVLSIDAPPPFSSLPESLMAMEPKATIFNYGFANQDFPFAVTFRIFSGPTLVYADTRQTTLDAGVSKQISFANTFIPSPAGNYSMEVFTSLSSDSENSNDTSRAIFEVGSLSIKNRHLKGLNARVFPNPFREKVMLELKESEGIHAHLKLTDIHGRLIIERKHVSSGNNETISLETSVLADGVYILNIEIDGISRNFRLVK